MRGGEYMWVAKLKQIFMFTVRIFYILLYMYFFPCGAVTQRGSWPPHS